jgi:hypothetical protein
MTVQAPLLNNTKSARLNLPSLVLKITSGLPEQVSVRDRLPHESGQYRPLFELNHLGPERGTKPGSAPQAPPRSRLNRLNEQRIGQCLL